MLYKETKLKGAYIIELQKQEDDRGFFARTWCRQEFIERGLNPNLVQCNISYNKLKGTLRGMHYQNSPHEEAKLVRCTKGSIFDVIIDLRPNSSTYMDWNSIVLTAENRTMLYIPEGIAHGFLTLDDDTEVFYQMSEFYHPECARGLHWADPSIGIEWSEKVQIISTMDNNYPNIGSAYAK